MEYTELDGIVKQQLAISASEWHGLLVGYLSLTAKVNLQTMPLELLDVVKLCPDTVVFVEEFAESVTDTEGSLSLFLPSEDAQFKVRLQALKDWVRGFLSGLGLAGFNDASFSDPEIDEVMRDLSEISEVDVNDIGDENDDEKFYTEIFEYVRSVALLIALAHHSQAPNIRGDDEPLH